MWRHYKKKYMTYKEMDATDDCSDSDDDACDDNDEYCDGGETEDGNDEGAVSRGRFLFRVITQVNRSVTSSS
jgi:hypothetical protein